MMSATVNAEEAANLLDQPECAPRKAARVSIYHAVAAIFIVDSTLFLASGLGPILYASASAAGVPSTMSAEVVLGAFIAFLVFQQLLGSYRRARLIAARQSTRSTIMSLLLTFSLLFMLGAATKVTSDFSRLWFFSWMSVSGAGIPFAHWMLLARLRRRLASGACFSRALAIGINVPPGSQRAIESQSDGQIHIARVASVSMVEDLLHLDRWVADDDIDVVHISVPWTLAPQVFDFLAHFDHLSANIFVNPIVENQRPFLNAAARDGGLQIQIADRPIEDWDLWRKRCLDLLCSYVAISVLLPVMVLVAIAIRLESRGPILFRQTRHGFNGRTFQILKFRSMYPEASDALAVRQTARHDHRVTLVGRFIRSTSLDELPQLFNVIRGEMSIVGPRPHGVATTAEGRSLSAAVREYASRHRVKPGITGWAQVNGSRGELDSIEKLQRRVRLDVEYIENWSIVLDLKILAKTIPLIFRDSGAY
jgi:exopolysaccharide biosynthesis polyprenyl glycosylphosphotransferase